MAYKDLKITRLELLMVKPRFMFLKMHTNQDIVGYGEPIMEGQAHAVAGVAGNGKLPAGQGSSTDRAPLAGSLQGKLLSGRANSDERTLGD